MHCPVCQTEMRGGTLRFKSSLWTKLLYPLGSLLIEKTAWFRPRVAHDFQKPIPGTGGHVAETAVCWTGAVLPAEFCDDCRLTIVFPKARPKPAEKV